jgi:sec-independent protein translocase protein TatA
MGLPFHPLWLVLILAIVLIIFGPGKLPELGGAVGRGIREFRKASSEITDEVKSSMDRHEPAPAPPPSSAATTTVTADHAAPAETETGKKS